MSNHSLMQKFTDEYCSPVILTYATNEVENVCLKNGLLFHEMLSSFGHLDGVTGVVRSNNTQISLSNPLLRFERFTEATEKTAEVVESKLNQCFQPYDAKKLPETTEELKTSPPTAWNESVEKTILHSMSFGEYDMLSCPLVALFAVSTTDADPMAAMNELCSKVHTPPGILSGLYEPDIMRVCVLVHDASVTASCHVPTMFKQIQAAFSTRHSRMLTFNYFPLENANIQQPDMWSRWMLPLYFPENTPKDDAEYDPKIIDPVTHKVIVGTRVSMEDLLVLRNFCISLFQEEVIPSIERRLATLGKNVADSRKGMKNVLKSFWRKPREETNALVKGQVRYKYDRIESQTVLLADTFFLIKDYDNALQLYKSVKDEYKSDKSFVHMAHTCIMMAICSYKLDTFSNNRYANMISYLEMLKEALAAFTIHNAPLHSTAYYCLLASELYMAAASPRAYYEAALYILIAAPVVVKFPWLNALVLERCARYFLHSGNTRKYVLYELIAGNKFQKCGEKALLHSTVCYSNIMLLIQDEKWGDLIIYLLRKLSDQLQIHAALGSELEKSGVLSPSSSLTPISSVCAEEKSLTTTAIQKRISKLSPQRGLLLLLHMLQCCTDASYIAGVQMEDEAMTVLLELMHKQAKVDGVGGSGEEESTPMNVHVTKEWNNCPGEEQEESPFLHARARRSGLSVAMPNYLLGDVPLEFQEMTNADTKASVLTTVENLQIPRIDTEATCLLTSINGNVKLMEHGTGFLFDPNAVSSLKRDIDGRGASCTYAHRSAAVANATLYHKAMLDTESLWWSAEMKSEKCSSLSTSNEANVFIDPIAVEELVEQSLTAEKGVTYQLQTEQRAKNSNNFKCPLLRVPFQEPIRVSLRVTNPLSMALLLTNVQVEILPMELGNPCHTNINNNQEALHTNCSSLFDIEKIECVLEPEETRVLVLSCTAIDSSTLHQKYEVNAVRYQLSESLIVRQCITKKGVLMQRTMAQRIDRVRDRDSSLQFEIIDAHPLLNINFLQNLPAGAVPDMPVLREIFAERQKNWTNEVLAGELVHTLLTIRNAGTSAAKNIQLKFNLPSVTASVLHSSKGQDDSACVQVGPLLKTQGVSCTVISLPEDTIIEVSQEIVLCVWFHLDPSPTSTSSATPNATLINSEGGVKQRVTLLVSYHPNTEDIATANTNDPGTKPRTSYTSADYVIFPSVHAHAKCVKKKSSIDEKLLVCNLYNQVVQNDSLSDIATGAGKSTRKPNVDLDFVDGGIAIDGILGLGNVAQTHANDKGIVGPTAFDVMAKPQEKITGGLHVSSLYSSCGSNDFVANKDHGQGTWLYKRQNGNSSDLNDPFSNILCTNALQNEVIERLLCNKACSGTYKQLLQQRRTEMSLEQEEMEETGPRTISQVRKERRKNREEETLCNDNGSGTESLNVSKLLYPRSWSDLVELQSLNGSLSLVVVWRCMWQNRTRIGCHIICHVPFMATGALNTTLLNKTPLLDYAYGYGCGSGMGLTKGNEQRALQECLSIALHHNPRIYISQDSIAKLQVHVELYSIATIDLYVHIECGDKRYLPQTSKSLRVNRNEPAEHRLCSYNVGRYSNNTGLMLKAMRWETEAKHTNCLVKPYCMRTFVFNCSFTHSGIFDVNRFKITISNNPIFTHSTASTYVTQNKNSVEIETFSVEYVNNVQSLVEVLD